MTGRRIEDPGTSWASGAGPKAGEYWKVNGRFLALTPNGLLADLAKHKVTEHDDGTITVSPSILVSGGGDGLQWHGHLINGVWSNC